MKPCRTRLAAALLIASTTLTLLTACASTRHALDGAWECVQPAPNTPAEREVKVIADGRFAFGVASGGPLVVAGGGACAYDGHQYTETVEYHWIPALVGRTIIFDCTLEGGLWRHEASFEAGGRQFHIDEVWRRVGSTPRPDGTAAAADGD